MTRIVFSILLLLFALGLMLQSTLLFATLSLLGIILSFILLCDLVGACESQNRRWSPLTKLGSQLKRELESQRCRLSLRASQLETYVREKQEAENLRKHALASAQVERLDQESFFERVLESLRRRFKAKTTAIVVGTAQGKRLYISGEDTVRLRSALQHLYEIYLRNPIAPTGLLDESLASRELADLSELGFDKSLVHRIVALDGTPFMIWLGYPCEALPSQFDQRAVLEFVSRFQEGLHSRAQLVEFEREVLNLKQIDSEKNQMLSHMSHDIRSPLNNVKTTLQLLKVEDTEGSSRAVIDSALNNCDSLAEIVDELMIYFQHSAGKLTASQARVDILHLVQKVVDAYSVTAMTKNLRLDVYSTAEEVMAFVDPMHARRVLSNLVGNALKYTQRGEILVSVDEKSQGYISICVHDTGLGMDKEQLEDLFTPFKRFHQREAEGFGLGLALSKALIELNKGRISVTSEKGKGSRFRVSFPVASAHAHEMQAEEIQNESVQHSHKRILLVDDDPDVVDSLARLLEGKRYEVDRCYSINDAKSICSFGFPDIILMDFRMPGGGAPQFLDFIRRRKSGSTCAVMTGEDIHVVGEQLSGFHVGHIFRKPLEMGDLEKWLSALESRAPSENETSDLKASATS